jgi:hypothetical protein
MFIKLNDMGFFNLKSYRQLNIPACGNSGKFWKILGNSGKFWKILENSGKFWEILENFKSLR